MKKPLIIAFILFSFLSCTDDDVTCSSNEKVVTNDEINANFEVLLKQDLLWERSLSSRRSSEDFFTINSTETGDKEISYEIVNSNNFEIEQINVYSLDAELEIEDNIEINEDGFTKLPNSLGGTYVFEYIGAVHERECPYILQLAYTFKIGDNEEVRNVNLSSK